MASTKGLTAEQLETFNKNGFLVVPGALSLPDVTTLIDTTNKILDEFDPSTHPLTTFTTGPTQPGESYFLTSATRISIFLEPTSLSPTRELLVPKHQAVNKIGHALHTLSPPFRHLTLTPRNRDIAADLGFKDPRVLQSMVICKPPGIGGEVPPHQDSTFLYTDPPSAVGWWYALDRAGAENGGLSFVKGSHRWAPIKQRFVRSSSGEGEGTEFIPNTGPVGVDAGVQAVPEENWEWEKVTANPGDLVLIHGNVLHKSEKNTSGDRRMIYTFHVIDGTREYDEKNWLQPGEEGFAGLREVRGE